MPTSMLLGVGAPGSGGGGGAPTNTVAPVASGSPGFASTLSTTNGSWTNSPTSFSYQWQTSTTGLGSWTNISGATASTYTTQSTDIGNYIRPTVSATNGSGTGGPVAGNVIGQITSFPIGMLFEILLVG